jgi:DNA modification methylase
VFVEHHAAAGERVFDPFAGSGTTLMACEELGRVCHAIEMEPSYIQVTIDRWEAFTAQTARKVRA